MVFSSNVKMLPVAALMLATFGTSTRAAEAGWGKTQSHAPDVSAATAGLAMQAGEPVHIAISLQLRNKAELDEIAADLMAGRSSTTISSEDFLKRYAPTQDRIDAVVAHLTRSGFVNIQVAQNKMMITADGTAGSAKSAFKVDMRHFKVTERATEREAYANLSDPVVPKELEKDILSVHGLQTVTKAHFNYVKAVPAAASASGEVGHSPSAWPTIYGGASLPTAANTTIGIITGGSMTQTLKDLKTFTSKVGFAMPTTSVVGGGTSTSGTSEWDIDSQDSLGAAGGVVKSMVFYAAKSMSDADLSVDYNAAVVANVAKVINVSLGECETDAKSEGIEATDDQIFEAAVTQGQTFAVAAGDSGSYECGGKTSAQSYPAVSPYVISVGGTTLTTTSAGAWSGETVWSCTSYKTCPQSADGGGGGGPSTTENAPSWQVAAGVLGSSTKRGVPDIAFDANPSSGGMPYVNGKTEQFGGTSLATPIFVGFWARIQSAHANSLAFPASAIYKYGKANASSIFHDVTSGSNGGYSATAGWDYTTGFGSLNVANFAAFAGANAGL